MGRAVDFAADHATMLWGIALVGALVAFALGAQTAVTLIAGTVAVVQLVLLRRVGERRRRAERRAQSLRAALGDVLNRSLSFDIETGLANERRLRREIQKQVARQSRYAEPVSLAVIRVVRVPAGKGALGAAGAAAVASVLKTLARTEDTVARTGPDMFAVLLVMTAWEGAEAFRDRVLDRLSSVQLPREAGGGFIDARVGLVQGQPEWTYEEWLAKARTDLRSWAAAREQHREPWTPGDRRTG